MEDQVMSQASTYSESGLIQLPKKRRKDVNNKDVGYRDTEAWPTNHASLRDKSTSSFSCSKRFLPINSNDYIYESEDYKSKGETLYVPLKDSILVNVQNIEQFSFSEGSFFIGDESMRFSKVVQGIALHLWRYSDTQQRLYISRSFVFTDIQAFKEIKKVLDSL